MTSQCKDQLKIHFPTSGWYPIFLSSCLIEREIDIDHEIERRMSFPPLQLAEKHHFDKKSDFASKFMKSRDYGVAPISGKSSCGMFLSAVRSTYSGCAQTSKYQVLGLDEFQSVISVKPIKEQRRSSFKDVFHGSSIFSGIAFKLRISLHCPFDQFELMDALGMQN